MKFDDIKKISAADLYWRYLFGRSKKNIPFYAMRMSSFKDIPAPVFFLSTGRCGTNWFAKLLSYDKSVKVFHEPRPILGVQGKTAYEIYSVRSFRPELNEKKLLKEVFLTAREQYLRYSAKTERRFIETGNQTTFFAPTIHDILPNTKFVHLNRHPGEFVRSALRRNFYNNIEDIKRITPVKENKVFDIWGEYDQFQKSCWLWSETNKYIEKFRQTIPEEIYFYFDFSQLSESQVTKMCRFLNINIPDKKIKNLLNKPVNMQRTGEILKYDNWPEADKKKLKDICGEIASLYNYEL